MYKKFIGSNGAVSETAIQRLNENGSITVIPFDPANTDYQAYLKWLAEGNQPLPADEGTPSA